MARIIALDLGSHTVKGAVFDQNGRRLELQDRISMPVPQDGETIPGQEAIWAALDALLEEHARWRAPGNDVGLAISAAESVLHRLDVPFTDSAQIEQTLPFAVEAEVPFDIDDVVLGWRGAPNEGGTSCVVALARRDVLSQRLEGLSTRQVEPRVVHVDGDLLGFYAGDDAVAVVDVGHTHTIVAVAVAGRTLGARAVDVGGWHFTRAIQDALECSWEDAEALKHGERTVPAMDEGSDPGFATGTHLPPVAARAVDAQMGLLLAGIRSSLITMEDQLGTELTGVMLSGGGSRLAPFVDYLRQDLGLPVEPLHDPFGDPVPGPFAVAHALAMDMGGRSKAKPIDLRVDEFAFRGGTDVLKSVAQLSGAAVMFFSLTAVVIGGYQYAQIYGERAEMDARIADYTVRTFEGVEASQITDATRASALASALTADAIQRARVLGTADGTPPTVDLLHSITKAFPPAKDLTVDVSELYITPTTVTLDAQTAGYTEAAAVEAAIKKAPRFADASKGEDKRVRDKVVFTVTIPLEEEEG
ncbi:MAG: pilus assembly protein PilM [Proteobacteria bacterium]|nr:pilus assembly protein PilM [Pseudomonadota bacterium]